MKQIMVLPFLAGFLAGLLTILAVFTWTLPSALPRDAAPLTRLKAAHADPGGDIGVSPAERRQTGSTRAVASILRQRVTSIVLRECILPTAPPARVDASEADSALQPESPDSEPAASAPAEPMANATILTPSPATPDTNQGPAASTVSASAGRTERSEAALYARALKAYESGRHALSRQEFAVFMRTFPRSSLMPNALYWTGETWYAQQRFDKAAQAFAQVSNRYPRHAKSPDALLKQAYSALRSGDSVLARRLLDSLDARYPGSRASLLGRRSLHGMLNHGHAGPLVTARG